jgi:hypothetical protein
VVLREHGFSWLTLLGDVERVMPYQVRLTRIGPAISSDGIKLSLEGVARTREAMLELFENLIADEAFADTLPKAEMTPEEGEVGYSFTLIVDYHPLASEPAPASEAEPAEEEEIGSGGQIERTEAEAVIEAPAEAAAVAEHEAEAGP